MLFFGYVNLITSIEMSIFKHILRCYLIIFRKLEIFCSSKIKLWKIHGMLCVFIVYFKQIWLNVVVIVNFEDKLFPNWDFMELGNVALLVTLSLMILEFSVSTKTL